MALRSSLGPSTSFNEGFVEQVLTTPLSSLLSPLEARENALKQRVKDLETELASVKASLTTAEGRAERFKAELRNVQASLTAATERAERAEAEIQKLVTEEDNAVFNFVVNFNTATKGRWTSTIQAALLRANDESKSIGQQSWEKSVKWLRAVEPASSPYFPQAGDDLVYLKNAHRQYLEKVKDARMMEVYGEMQKQSPFIEIPDLPDAVHCRLSTVDFDLSLPGIVCLKLACSEAVTFKQDSNGELTVFYRPIPGTTDFLLLQSKSTPSQHWKDRCAEMSANVAKVMKFEAAQPFLIFPSQEDSRKISYPVDLTIIKSRLDNVFYRRATAVIDDVKQLKINALATIEPTNSEARKRVKTLRDILISAITYRADSFPPADWQRRNQHFETTISSSSGLPAARHKSFKEEDGDAASTTVKASTALNVEAALHEADDVSDSPAAMEWKSDPSKSDVQSNRPAPQHYLHQYEDSECCVTVTTSCPVTTVTQRPKRGNFARRGKPFAVNTTQRKQSAQSCSDDDDDDSIPLYDRLRSLRSARRRRERQRVGD